MAIERSHGPDPFFGPGSCRGLPSYCGDYADYGDYVTPYGDLECCCDPCKHDKTGTGVGPDLCHGHCCKCVPRSFVARFIPSDDYQSKRCRENGTLMFAEHDLIETTYVGWVRGAGEIHMTIQRRPYDLDQTCIWRIEVPDLYIDDEYELDGRTISCKSPPTFVIEDVVYEDVCGDPCEGNIVIEPYEESKIPFRRPKWEDQPETIDVNCGGDSGCGEVCWAICVTRSTEAYGEEDRRHTFFWSEDEQCWNGGVSLEGYECGEEKIDLVEIEGECYLRIKHFEMSEFVNDLIKVDPNACAKGMNLFAEDELGSWIRISCNPCWCWNYVCGKCRCICSELCLVGMDGNDLVGPFALSWDEYLGAWTDGNEVVSLDTEPIVPECGHETRCVLRVPGFDEATPVADVCRSGLSLTVADDSLLEDYGYYRWRAAWCRIGQTPCDAGNCGTFCDDIPSILYADCSPMEWEGQHYCEDMNDGALCFEPFTIPLVLVAIPHPDAAADFMWTGAVTVPCRSCEGDETTHLVQVWVQCDGLVVFALRSSQSSGWDCSMEDFIATPCARCDVPLDETLEFDVDECSLPAVGPCCNNAGVKIHLSE